MTNKPHLITLKGPEITPFLSSVAQLELDTFKEYPYLYDETLNNQITYLTRYAECPKSIMILVQDENKIVGVSTGIPLVFDTEKFKKPFLDNGINSQTAFYLGESLLLPAYRGKKIYREFFSKREESAKEYGCTISTFISVERDSNDARQPKNYVSLDAIWHHFGYKKHPELYVDVEWKDIGDKAVSKKRLVYWLKYLE